VRVALTDKQLRFVEYYCGVSNGNATDAARRAGFGKTDGSHRELARRELTKVDIRAAIKERFAAVAMEADECLSRISAQARATLADVTMLEPVFEDKGGLTCPWPKRATRYLIELDWKKLHDTGLIHQVAEIKWTNHGPAIKLHDVQGALKVIAQAHGLTKDSLELSGQIGVTVREYPEGL
jgi:hypothetical protein